METRLYLHMETRLYLHMETRLKGGNRLVNDLCKKSQREYFSTVFLRFPPRSVFFISFLCMSLFCVVAVILFKLYDFVIVSSFIVVAFTL